jgi:hypothetical protein
MPVLDQERVSTRSALRYRPLPVTDQARPGPVTARRSRIRADSSAPAARAIPDELDVEEKETPPPRRRSTAPAPSRKTTQAPASRARRHLHPLLFVGVGLMAFVLLWVGVTQAFIWGNNILNGLRYGYPRTFQMDAMVGHQDSASAPSHFLAINLRGQVEVLEWPGGNASHARVYLGPQLFGPGSDLEPVTLRFSDLNGDQLPDMVITVQGSQIVLINAQGSFRPMRPDEQGPIMQRLHELGQ